MADYNYHKVRWEEALKVICLTGGLAAGKSTASKFLEERGADIIDADRLGHRVYDSGTRAFRQVVDIFGEDIVNEDNRIDRKILGGKVFGNPDKLKKLTDIVWPEIRRLAMLEINAFEAFNPAAVIVLEAAVLFEAGWEDIGDEVWVVVVDREVAIVRAIRRDGLDRQAIETRLDSQLSNEERISKATVVINNSSTPEAMLDQLEKELHHLLFL